MAKISVNLQDSFLNQIRKENSEIKIVMLDGSVLTGLVKGFDNFTIILNSKGSQHLIYKHAVSQLISRKPIQKSEDSDKKFYDKENSANQENKNIEDVTIPKFVNSSSQIPSPKKVDNFNPIDISNLKK